MSVLIVINALIIAVIAYLVDKFVSVSGMPKSLVIGVLAALALLFLPPMLP